MSITEYIDQFAREARISLTELANGACLERFQNMTSEEQQETAIKVALLSLAAIGFSVVIDIIVAGSIITAVVSIGAFAYFTNSNRDFEWVKEKVQATGEAIKQGAKKIGKAFSGEAPAGRHTEPYTRTPMRSDRTGSSSPRDIHFKPSYDHSKS